MPDVTVEISGVDVEVNVSPVEAVVQVTGVPGTTGAKGDPGAVVVYSYTAATPVSLTPDVDTYDQFNITGLTQSLSINAPVGSPADGKRLLFRIKDTGTPQLLTWNAAYGSVSAPAPTQTTDGTTLYVGFLYNATRSAWDIVAVKEL